ncbi:unknown [Alistipes sp. CAG:831]|nr:unknown [Alistipes sp. CAG:831]
MKNIFTVLSVIAATAMVLYSCSDKADNIITVLTDEVKTGAVSVKGDTVCTFPDTVFFQKAWMADDRHAICETRTAKWGGLSQDQWAFEVYDIRAMQPVAHFLHSGNGPFEVLSPLSYVVDDTLYVMESSKGKLYVIPVDKAAEGKGIQELSFKFNTMKAVTYKGNILSLNPYWFENKETGVSNGEPKLFYSDGELIPYDESKIFSGNCFQGHLLTNPDKGTIVYVENSYPLVEFYDDSLRLVRSIIGPDKTKPEYLNAGNSLFHAKYYGSIYGCVCCDDRYIYLNYNDELSSEPFMTTELVDGSPVISVNDDTDDSEKETEPKDVLILVLDWKGNPQSSYRLEGLKGCTAISSGRDGTLYASVKDTETDQLSILRYKLF